jgi:hypothetical protein
MSHSEMVKIWNVKDLPHIPPEYNKYEEERQNLLKDKSKLWKKY